MNKKLKSFCIKQLPKYFRKYAKENEVVDIIDVDNGAIIIKVLYKQETLKVLYPEHFEQQETLPADLRIMGAMVIWHKLTRVFGNIETWNKQQIEDFLKKELPAVCYVEIGKILDVSFNLPKPFSTEKVIDLMMDLGDDEVAVDVPFRVHYKWISLTL